MNGRAFSCGALALTIAASTTASATPVTSKGAAHAAPSAAEREKTKVAAKEAAILLLAPADEYFGPLKVSIIGIRNTMRDLGLRYDVNHDIGPQTYSSAQLVERAIRDWEKKYPHDDQLPRAVYFLQRLYVKILTEPAREHATAIASWMFKDFGTSPQSKQLQKTVAAEHLAPIPAGAVLAMPSPTTVPVAIAPSNGTSAAAGSPTGIGTTPGGATLASAPVSRATSSPASETAPESASAPIAEAAAASAALGSSATARVDATPTAEARVVEAPRPAVRSSPVPVATPASVARVAPPNVRPAAAPVVAPTAQAGPAPAGSAESTGDATTEGAAYGSSFGAGYPSIFAPAPSR